MRRLFLRVWARGCLLESSVEFLFDVRFDSTGGRSTRRLRKQTAAAQEEELQQGQQQQSNSGGSGGGNISSNRDIGSSF